MDLGLTGTRTLVTAAAVRRSRAARAGVGCSPRAGFPTGQTVVVDGGINRPI